MKIKSKLGRVCNGIRVALALSIVAAALALNTVFAADIRNAPSAFPQNVIDAAFAEPLCVVSAA